MELALFSIEKVHVLHLMSSFLLSALLQTIVAIQSVHGILKVFVKNILFLTVYYGEVLVFGSGPCC